MFRYNGSFGGIIGAGLIQNRMALLPWIQVMMMGPMTAIKLNNYSEPNQEIVTR